MGEGPRTEEIKGRVKEAAGTLTGQEDMENEGEAQRKKASAQEEARQKEAEAIEAEQHQRANQ